MKIVHIGPSNLPLRHSRGGAIERRILELAAAQSSVGHEVTVYSAETHSESCDFRGFRIEAIACARSGFLRRLEFLRKSVRHAQAKEMDIVHFHSMPEAGLLARHLGAGKLLSYDYFIFRRGKQTPLYWLYRYALKGFNYLLPVSDFCRSESLAYWRLPHARTRVFYNGVNLDQFRPDAEARQQMRAKLGVGNDPVILYIGRVCLQKGTDILINAYRLLRTVMPSVRLLVAGPAEQFGTEGGNDLTAQITSSGGLYLGPVHEADLAAVYNSCDIFVMPTRRDEMFGMAAAEAQACGKPVVCSLHGGLPEVVSRDSGAFFPVGKPEALASEIAKILNEPTLLTTIALNARSNATRFGWQRLVTELDEIYTSVLPLRNGGESVPIHRVGSFIRQPD
jgi:glycosyltransferase involved in cell wall biosynthesis